MSGYPVRPLLLLVVVLALTSCMVIQGTSRNTYRGVATLSAHSRAVSAMDKGDLDAAQRFLIGTGYTRRHAQISGRESWGHLHYRAAKIVVSASNEGRAVDDTALCLAYIALFESSEGLPDDPEQMLDYMHKAVAMLQSNPDVLDKANPKLTSQVLSEYTMQRYVLWQYLSDGGSIDWTLPEPRTTRVIAGVGYDDWFGRFEQTLQGRGSEFLAPFASYGRDQFVREAVDLSRFPVFVCVSSRKDWNLTPPPGYRYDNFRGGGPFDVVHCGQDQPAPPTP